MLYIDSVGQIRVGLSEPFSMIGFEKLIYTHKIFAQICGPPTCSKIDFQTRFRVDFYTKPFLKTCWASRTVRISRKPENLMQIDARNEKVYKFIAEKRSSRLSMYHTVAESRSGRPDLLSGREGNVDRR